MIFFLFQLLVKEFVGEVQLKRNEAIETIGTGYDERLERFERLEQLERLFVHP